MADGKFTTMTAARLRKVNEIIMSVRGLKPPEKLFDEFWREGELALLFGPRGTGKSILAMQVAEGLARGRAIDGFEMSEKRHKVLYVDLKLSERQFGMRYTNEGKQYKVSENLYRDRPESNDKLCEWLGGAIRDKGFRVIVIDDLSAVKQTYDGTRETLKLMRDLKQLKDELDVSILVLAGSNEQRRGELISEAHMMRSRVLCDAADSVFALGVHAHNTQWRYLLQTRSQSAAITWHGCNVPMCRIKRFDDGFLGFTFDERFVAEIDEETRQLICNIKWRRDANVSFRAIAEELGIASSTAFRPHKKWTASLEKNLVVEPVCDAVTQRRGEAEEWEECGYEKPSWLDHEEELAKSSALPLDVRNGCGVPATLALPSARTDAFPAAPKNHSGGYASDGGVAAENAITDDGEAELRRTSSGQAASENGPELKRGFDGYGREIFIEKEDEYTGKPIIWYNYDSKKRVRRFERDVAGIAVTMVKEPSMSVDLKVPDAEV